MIDELKNIVDSFKPVSLEEMDSVKLMDRYDTKYLLPVRRVPELLKMMAVDYRVLEVNSTRISGYNTTYLDTADYSFYTHHITGREGRMKIRFRKYLSTGTTFLEIKKKNKKQKTVKWRIENELCDNAFDQAACEFINNHLPFNSAELKPVISNSFKRITFVRFDIPERITLDLDLSFTGPDGRSRELPLVAIAELKSQGLAVRSPFYGLIRSLSFFPVGFSKYCTGLAMLYEVPRKNFLKEKILLLTRIENEYNGILSA
jgi:hypothetical protein